GRSVERDERRFKVSAVALIALIDLVVVLGLFLVHWTVRRQVHLAQVKSDFVTSLGHELESPIGLIHLFAETLDAGHCPTEEKRQQYYKVINQESQRLSALVNNLLDFARIEEGGKEYRFALTPLGPLVREVVELYRAELERQGFVLETAI